MFEEDEKLETGIEEEVIETEETEVIEETEEPVVDEETPDEVFTKDQVQRIIQGRVKSSQRKIEKLQPYETAMNKLTELTGMTVDDILERLNSMSVEEQAQILGVSPQDLQMQNSAKQAQRMAEKKLNEANRSLEEQKILANPKCADFALYREEIYDLVEENPKLSLTQAYTLVKSETMADTVARDAEQRAVAKMKKSTNQKVVKPGQAQKKAERFEPGVVEAATKVGMTPQEYAAFANMSSYEDYEKMMKDK